MTANPMHPRTLEIPADTAFDSEDSAGFRTYIASIPGKGVTRIEVAWSAVQAFEECVIGRVGPVPPRPYFGEFTRGGLSQTQLDGFACVECGAGQGPGVAFIPAGYVLGAGRVFQCADKCPVAPVEPTPRRELLDHIDPEAGAS